MHSSLMNVTTFSTVACTGKETMRYEAEASTECAVRDIHASTTVYKIPLNPHWSSLSCTSTQTAVILNSKLLQD